MDLDKMLGSWKSSLRGWQERRSYCWELLFNQEWCGAGREAALQERLLRRLEGECSLVLWHCWGPWSFFPWAWWDRPAAAGRGRWRLVFGLCVPGWFYPLFCFATIFSCHLLLLWAWEISPGTAYEGLVPKARLRCTLCKIIKLSAAFLGLGSLQFMRIQLKYGDVTGLQRCHPKCMTFGS